MRIVVLLLFSILMGMVATRAQNKPLLYDFYEVPQSLMLNPGVKTAFQSHIGIPALSGFSFQAGISGVTLNDIFADDGVDFTTKFVDKVINSLDKNDEFGLSGTIEVFNIGFRSKNRSSDYISFGMYGEGFLAQYWPEDLGILAAEGNATNLNRRFSLNHIANQGEAVSVFHFGINRRLNRKWTVGARAKLYSSIFEFKSANNSGYFVTTLGENNILRNTLVADYTMRTSGLREILNAIDDDNDNTRDDLTSVLLGRSFLGGNLGVGLDLGFTHSFGKNSFITASLLDLGFIYHSNAVRTYTLNGAATNEGIEIVLPDDLTNFDGDIWENLINDLEAQVPYESNEKSYVSLRPLKLYTSFRYNFGERQDRAKDCECSIETISRSDNLDYLNAVGGQFFLMNRARGPQAALTAFYQRRLGNLLALKTTYTLDKYSFTNVGLGLNLQTGPLNFYLLAGNVLSYVNLPNSNYASLQFGFNILSWNGN